MAHWLYCQSCGEWSKSAVPWSDEMTCPMCGSLFKTGRVLKPFPEKEKADEQEIRQNDFWAGDGIERQQNADEVIKPEDNETINGKEESEAPDSERQSIEDESNDLEARVEEADDTDLKDRVEEPTGSPDSTQGADAAADRDETQQTDAEKSSKDTGKD